MLKFPLKASLQVPLPLGSALLWANVRGHKHATHQSTASKVNDKPGFLWGQVAKTERDKDGDQTERDVLWSSPTLCHLPALFLGSSQVVSCS